MIRGLQQNDGKAKRFPAPKRDRAANSPYPGKSSVSPRVHDAATLVAPRHAVKAASDRLPYRRPVRAETAPLIRDGRTWSPNHVATRPKHAM